MHGGYLSSNPHRAARLTLGPKMAAQVQEHYGLSRALSRALVGEVLDAVVLELRKVVAAIGHESSDLAVAARTMALRMEIAAERARAGKD